MGRATQVKYAVYPGFIRSKNDGDRHYVGFLQLCRLYGINHQEAMNMSSTSFERHGFTRERLDELIALRPRYLGDYKEHLEEVTNA